MNDSWWHRTDVATAVRGWWGAGRFGVRSASSRRPICDDHSGVDVALTSYGTRLDRVHVVIESIAAGRLRPSSLTLSVADPGFVAEPPTPIRRQIDRGLRVVLVRDSGPHKKYLHAVTDPLPGDRPLVTADDDVLYPVRWLADLVTAARSGDHVVAHRARRIRLTERLGPYRTWPLVDTTAASHLHVPTGVGGVLYPPRMVAALRRIGDHHPPEVDRCDDLWLHAVALREGIRVRQVRAEPLDPVPLPGLGTASLMQDNVDGGGNDVAAAALYGEADLAVLRAESSGEPA